MSITHIPNGFTSVTPYFIVENAKTFQRFLIEAFDAEIIDEHYEDEKFQHGAYKVFGSMIESSEGNDSFQANQISIHLYVPDCDEVYQKALSAGGTSIHEVFDMPYGERSGGIIDPCGNHWYIATQKTDMYPQEGK